MLSVAVGKIIKNKWLFLCLLVACIFSVALIASLPAYGNAIQMRMLQRAFTERFAANGRLPLVYSYRASDTGIRNWDGDINALDAYVKENLDKGIGLPVLYKRETYTSMLSPLAVHIPTNGDPVTVSANRTNFSWMDGLFERVELVAGRMPGEGYIDGAYECIISERQARDMPFMIGSLYTTTPALSAYLGGDEFNYRIVGVFRLTDPADPYWTSPPSEISLFMMRDTFLSVFHGNRILYRIDWNYALDHTALEPAAIPKILETLDDKDAGFLSNTGILRAAAARERLLVTFLWVLQVPNLALIVFLTIMLSGLILEHDKLEISLLYSRGAGKGWVFGIYTAQTLLLAAVALAAGIPFSMLLCSIMGASSGFLEFVGRSPLQARINREVLQYAFAGAGVFVVSMLLPVLFLKSDSIVAARRAKAARSARPFFEKMYLDVIMVAVSLYGYYSYRNLSSLLTGAGLAADEIFIDPLIFLISTFFFTGCAMLFTRLYPYIIKLLFAAGRKFWPPAVYASLSAARTRPRSRYIMLFIIMTVSIGLYSSSAARTINKNLEDRAVYEVGADVTLMEKWRFIDLNPPEYDQSGSLIQRPDKDLFFTEPLFDKFTSAPGVTLATKVYRNNMRFAPATVSIGAVSEKRVQIIAIQPAEFAEISWRRGDMYDYHLNYYMNAMARNPNVVLLSRNLMEKLGVSHGSTVQIQWPSNDRALSCVVYDAIDYFPTYDPSPPGGEPSYLAVMNYRLVSAEYHLEPYEVWIKKEDGVPTAVILEHLNENNVPLVWVRDSATARADVKNDPFVLSLNGYLTLSFVVTIAVTAVGFLVFWIFDLKSRRLQIGIMRSMGMFKSDVVSMLLWEQAILSLLPMLAGFILGNAGSALFVPMLELGAAASAPPFRVFSYVSDMLRVGAIVTGIILLAIMMLWQMAARLNISQTLKLGEE